MNHEKHVSIAAWLKRSVLHLVGDGHAALSGIKDGELVGLSVGVHDDLEKAFIFFTATV